MKEHYPTRQNILPKDTRFYAASQIGRELPASPGAENAGQTPLLLAAVVGLMMPPRPMSLEEIQALGDPFTSRILLKGAYPLTLRALIDSISALHGQDALPVRKLFLVAEGGQFRLANPEFEVNARLVFTWQKNNATPPDILLSTVASMDNDTSLLQLIAWSDQDGAFHFFERKEQIWGWAGHSFHALTEPSRGKGPFDSHINGGLVMKELKFPWTHWHSQTAGIPREVFPSQSEFRNDPLFGELSGAETLETIVKAGVSRWTKSRLAADKKQGKRRNLPGCFRQIVTPTSENLVSTSLEFKRARNNTLKLPSSFFIDIDGLEAGVGFDAPIDVIPGSLIQVDGSLYTEAVRALDMKVPDAGGGLPVEGDTHFCFLVPERAFEDTEIARQMLAQGMISSKLLLCLLMVDFVNPVRSESRAGLLNHCPAELEDGRLMDDFFVRQAAAAADAGGVAEAEFLSYWNTPDLFTRMHDELAAFFEGVQKTVMAPEGVVQLVQLAEWRKLLFRKRELNEFASTTSMLGRSLTGPVHINKHGVISMLPDQHIARL